MGYSGPDAKARSLRTGRTRIVAVILSESLTYSLNDAVVSEFLAGVAEVLDDHDHTLLLLPGHGHTLQPLGSTDMADGLIVYGPLLGNNVLHRLPNERTVVSVDFDIDGCPTVHIDDRDASYAMAMHALKQRPTRPAIINLRVASRQQHDQPSTPRRVSRRAQ